MADEIASIKFDDKKARRFFDRIIKQSKKVEKQSRDYVRFVVGKRVIEDVEEHFEDQQGGPSKLWPEWSDVYLQHMRRIGKQGNNILADTGRLRRSFGLDNYQLSGDGIEFFNPAKTAEGFPYAAAHNKGGGKLPQRKFMWLSSKAKKRILRDTINYMLNQK